VYALQRLKQSGARVAIDDFGTGYSSLAYLKRFAVDELKIDRSFVKDLPADANDAALTTAIIAMAHSLGISLTAEGVETEAQRAFLERSGCDAYQGFLYSRPVPATVIPSLVGVVDADLAA
jgi:EAL domain-containing protein (putative c-di-GMP-specific phosphodiesterase class I)